MKSTRSLAILAVLTFAVTERAATASDAPLRAGDRVEATLAAGEVRPFPLEAAPGDFVQGNLEKGRGRLALIDAAGGRERVLVEEDGRREFLFVSGDRGPYSLELRAGEAGPFVLKVERIVPLAAQVKPKEVLESPRLRRLQETLAAGGGTDEFWGEVERGRGPVIETEEVEPPLADGQALVTFVWRGARRGVRLFGAPSNDFDDLKRLGDSDVWFGSYRVPRTARVTYKYAPDVPELDASPMVRRRAILATAQRDPFNPKHLPEGEPTDKYAGESLLELPDAPPCPWLDRKDGVPTGSVERLPLASTILGNTRDVWVYRPHGYTPGADGNALLVLFDGERYMDEVPTPRILDNLIAAGAIPPTAAVLVGNPTSESRSAELPPNPKFARFLAEELTPWARERGVHAPASATVVAGASYGGLAAAYAGVAHPEIFGKVLSQSGSFWWAPGSSPAAEPDEPEWLARQVAKAPAVRVVFHFQAGTFEVGRGGSAGIRQTSQHLRDVLEAKGCIASYADFGGGHGYAYWRYTLADGLIKLLGRPVPAP